MARPSEAQQYAVFLRGINVGGANKVLMKDLVACVELAGLSGARTFLQSGNVVGACEVDRQELQEVLEAALTMRFHYTARVVVHTRAEVEMILQEAGELQVPPSHHLYAILSSNPAVLAEMMSEGEGLATAEEHVSLGSLAFFWQVPKGQTLATPLSKMLTRKRFAEQTTARNINTLARLKWD